MGIRIGVAGTGEHAQSHIQLLHAHPLVDEVVLADLVPQRVQETAATYGIKRTVDSLDALCAMDIDAIAIMTQRHLHGPQAMQALEAGKHVYCAVPIGQSIDEIRAVVQRVEQTGLIYQTNETSYYYPSAIYCRDRFRKGDFGHVVYGEGRYFHDMSHFYDSFKRSGGENWKWSAGIPPMYYPTHSVGMVASVTGAHAVNVSCLGWEDNHEDAIFRKDANAWGNVFSNETALFAMSDGSSIRANEFRRIGCWGPKPNGTVLMSLYGTEGSYEEHSGGSVWVSKDRSAMQDLDECLKCAPIGGSDSPSPTVASSVHRIGRLPKTFAGLRNGHQGSHQFLADDFCKAVASGKQPPNHVWAAARYCIPGLVAHESAQRGGQRLPVPDLGDPPADWQLLNPDDLQTPS